MKSFSRKPTVELPQTWCVGSRRDMHVIVVLPSKSTSSIYYDPKNAPNKSEASTAKRQWKILSKVASDCGKS